MKSHLSFFKKKRLVPVDEFFRSVLYDKKVGYYNSKFPFGKKGDYITAPKISILFSEIIGIWILSTWEKLGRPKNFNVVELGPGDGSLTKDLVIIFKKFSEFNSIKKIYLYETSNLLKKIQKKNINDKNVRWVNNFDSIRKGPVIFFGNEFFDAIPIKQFKKEKKNFLEKYYFLNKNYEIVEIYKKAKKSDIKLLRNYKVFHNLKFIEFPKFGILELKKIVKKISKLNGCLLLIDYGYLKSQNKDTLESVFEHKKNSIFKNLGKADVTSHVNFTFLKEFFFKNKLKVKRIISQKEFLENMGIIQRAEIISKKMNFKEKSSLYLRLQRLLNPRLMGNLFKVIEAYKFKGFNI